MHPDIILFGILLLAIILLATRIIYLRTKGTPLNSNWTKAVSHLGQISLALGVMLQLVELTTALESATNSLTTEEIAKGLSATIYPTIHGLFVYVVSLALYVGLRLTEK